MITREEQKALYDSITGDLVLNTHPDGVTGTNETIPVEIHWGFEPTEVVFPVIIITFIIYGNPTMRTIGDLWKSTEEGEFTGYIAEYTLLVKIKTADYNVAGKFIEKTDIAEALYQRVFNQALHYWDGLIDDGSVVFGGISPVSDVSSILGLEIPKELQFTIRIQRLTGGVPVEAGPVLYTTAPTITVVDGSVIYQ